MINFHALLVNWNLGVIIIGVFTLVVIALIAIIYNLTQKRDEKSDSSEDIESTP